MIKIRKVFESITDIDDMFEIFKDIVDDVLLIEFDRELDYDFDKGQILIDRTSIGLEGGSDIPDIDDTLYKGYWGFKFCMPDKREDKKRIQERIGQLFERQTGIKVGFYELGDVGYSHVGSKISVLCSKKEWITYSVNLRDFEEILCGFELPEKYSFLNIIDNFYYNKNSNRSSSFIVEVGNSMGMKIDLQRSQLLHELDIKEDGDFTYNVNFYPCCYYGGTWLTLTDKMDKVEVFENESPYVSAFSKNRNYVDIDESLKMMLINASKELKTIKNFTINLLDDSDDNLEVFTSFLCNQVFPKFQTKEVEQMSQVESEIDKLKESDNIEIDIEIANKTKDSIIYLCETDFKGKHYIFKFTLNTITNKITLHSNVDENNDGPDLYKFEINELSDILYLSLTDGKLVGE